MPQFKRPQLFIDINHGNDQQKYLQRSYLVLSKIFNKVALEKQKNLPVNIPAELEDTSSGN